MERISSPEDKRQNPISSSEDKEELSHPPDLPRLIRSGRFAEARKLAEKQLAESPSDITLLNNLTIIYDNLQLFSEAENTCARLLELAPGLADAHFNHGNLLMHKGEIKAAAAAFGRAIELNPDHVAAWFNKGLCLRKSGDNHQAATCFERAAELDPRDPDTFAQLGLAYHMNRDLSRALLNYRRGLSLAPDSPHTWYNMGIALYESRQYPEAEDAFRHCLELSPQNHHALNYLGMILSECDGKDEAENLFNQALTMAPDFAEARNNLGHLMKERGDLVAAEKLFRRAIADKPEFDRAWYNLASTIQEDLRIDEAIEAFTRAIEINPDFVEAHWNLSHVLLLAGDFRRGFTEYLWRWRRPATIKPDIKLPLWDGRPAPEARLLVHAEQGIGDAIQFVRYLVPAGKMVKGLMLVCPAALVELFQKAGVADAIVASSAIQNLARVTDYHCPLLDLPRFFTAAADEIPLAAGYLKAPRDLIPSFEDIARAPGIKVGVVWQGNPKHKNDHNRSCPYPLLRELFTTPGASFFSLNKGAKIDPSDPVTDLAPRLADFAHTAAAIHHLDLVISVDTSVAHLAGAMGRPVWTMLPFFPDWRWLLSRPDSTPWYDSMRLFRQGRDRDYRPVIARIKEELSRLAQAR